MPSREWFEFDDFVLDPAERRLIRSGQAVPLEPKAFEILVALVTNAGRLLTKRELLDAIWAGAFVEEGILSVHVSSLRRALDDRAKAPRYIETVSRSGYRFIAGVTARPAGASYAILPAQPFSSELLSDRDRSIGLALADALIDRLGRSPQIVVRPTRAVQSYPSGADAASAGRSLRVDAVLDSLFVRTGDRLRLSAQLLRSNQGDRVWSGHFDQPAADVNAIADAVAQSVSDFLGLRSVAHRALPAPVSPQVYELFGRGRSHLLSASMFQIPDAVAAFRSAIELEPRYAAAHAGLALACCAQAELRVAPIAVSYAEAKASALRALAMDDLCADAQVALGAVLFLGEWDWDAARQSFERAIEINPNHTEAYLLYGRLLEALGRLDEGLSMKLRALERDPLSPLVHLQISMAYFHQRRFDDAIEWANRTLELDPRHMLAREHLAGAYWAKGDYDRQMAETVRHAEAFGAPKSALAPLLQAYSTGGRPAVVQMVLEQAAGKASGAVSIMLAVHHAEAGNRDEAFRYLEEAIQARDPILVHLAVAPQWDSLRADPRFDRCLARLGLRP